MRHAGFVCLVVLAVAVLVQPGAALRGTRQRLRMSVPSTALLEVNRQLARGTPVQKLLSLVDNMEKDVKDQRAVAEASFGKAFAECQDETEALRAEIVDMSARINATSLNMTRLSHKLRDLEQDHDRLLNESRRVVDTIRVLQHELRDTEAQHNSSATEHAERKVEAREILEAVEGVRQHVQTEMLHMQEVPVSALLEQARRISSSAKLHTALQAKLDAAATLSGMRAQGEPAGVLQRSERRAVAVRRALELLHRMQLDAQVAHEQTHQLASTAHVAWMRVRGQLSADIADHMAHRARVAAQLTRVTEARERVVQQLAALHARHEELAHALHPRADVLEHQRTECQRKQSLHASDEQHFEQELDIIAQLRALLNERLEELRHEVEAREREAEQRRREEAERERHSPRHRSRSCLQLLRRGQQQSGVYRVFRDVADEGTGYDVYCDMETAGGGWTLAAVVANDGAEYWSYGASDGDRGDLGSLWENDRTLGEVDAHTAFRAADFKSPAYGALEADEIMIAFNGHTRLRTVPGCLRGRSLRAAFNSMLFSCAPGRYECAYGAGAGAGACAAGGCGHACAVAEADASAADDVLTGGQRAHTLLLKAGEAGRGNAGKVGRAYLSTLPSRRTVDLPEGLGAYVAFHDHQFSHDACVHGSKCVRPGNDTLFHAVYVRETRAGAVVEEVAASCAAHRAAGHNVTGLYRISPAGAGDAYLAYCDQETAGGGWTLAAVVSNSFAEHWRYTHADGDAGDLSSLWENAETLGEPHEQVARVPSDFKSRAFLDLPASELLLTFKGRPLLRTAAGCLHDRSLKDNFNHFRFSCAGAERSCHYGVGACAADGGCTHSCAVEEQFSHPADDVVTRGLDATSVHLKAGAADGAQDYNKERSYLSTAPSRTGAHFPEGLGSFVAFGDAQFSHNMGTHAKGSRAPEDRSLFNGIFVR